MYMYVMYSSLCLCMCLLVLYEAVLVYRFRHIIIVAENILKFAVHWRSLVELALDMVD